MSESIKVVCRVRPLNELELSQKNSNVISFPGEKSISLSGRETTFDAVFKSNTDQRHVYEVTARPIIDDILTGYNGTIFAYGQTGSGKTFTMEGVPNDPVYQGIVPRIVEDIFNRIYDMNENLEFEIKVSFVEIYLERIRDLLDLTKTNLSIHESVDKKTIIRDVTERFVSSPAEVLDILEDGRSNRAVGATKMNQESSRSHSIVCIDVVQHDKEKKRKLIGKLRLVDLAGSEKVAKTGAEGLTLEEAKEINKSLSCLGNVINALMEHKSHVPYRDSKLTRVLQKSLGGNARTTIIICISPASSNEEESRSTVGFGVRAKKIKNQVRKNEELTGEEWRRRYLKKVETTTNLVQVVHDLEAELYRWRGGDSVPATEWVRRESYEKTIKYDEDKDKDKDKEKDKEKEKPDFPRLKSTTTAAPHDVEKLYRDLDNKDAEIARLGQCLERAKADAEDRKKQLETSKKALERKAGTLQQLQAETYNEQMEIKEVLEALEELAINYDQKVEGLEAKSRDMAKLEEELNTAQGDLLTKDSELERLKEQIEDMKKKYRDIMVMLFNDMIETGEILAPNVRKPEFNCNDRPEDQATALRLYMTKLRTEAKNVATRVKLLELETKRLNEESAQHEEVLKNLSMQCQRLQGSLQRAQTRLEDTRVMRETTQVEKDKLQTLLSNAYAELAVLKQAAAGKPMDEIREVMHSRLQHAAENYTEEMEKRRRNSLLLQKELDEAKEEILTLKLQLKQNEDELAKAREDKQTRGNKMSALEVQAEKRDRAHQDLSGLEDTVIRELQTLHNLRKMFVTDLQRRIKKASKKSPGSENESEGLSIAACRQKVTFLESNVQQLTQVHKQLVRNNAALRGEVPKMEKRLLASGERVTALETALKEAKESSLRDRRRYQLEVNRIKDAMKQRNMTGRRTKHAKIMMPVRSGVAKA